MATCELQGKQFFCREWVFAKLLHCLEQRASGKALGTLILGGAGSGKTALCCELVWPSTGVGAGQGRQRALHRRLLAHHFCHSGDVTTLNPADFIHYLVQQISCSDYIQGYTDKLRDPEVVSALDYGSCQRDPDEAFKRAVLFPLLELDPPKHTCLLVVDGLDEGWQGVAPGTIPPSNWILQTLDENGGTIDPNSIPAPPMTSGSGISRTVAELLASHHHLLPSWLLLLCTARRTSRNVARLFSGFRKITLDDLRKPQVLRDVQQYILLRLENEESLRQHVSRDTAEMLHQLHVKSNGCFLYLERVLDGVSDGSIVLREVRHIPGTLNGLYLWLCQRLFNRKQFHKVQPILSAILAVRRPLSGDQLFECVWTRHLNLTPQEYSRRMELLKRVLLPETCRLFHSSFAEWLMDVKHCTQKYLCCASEGHAMHALRLSRHGSELTAEDTVELAIHISQLPPAAPQWGFMPWHRSLWLIEISAPVETCLEEASPPPAEIQVFRVLEEAGAKRPVMSEDANGTEDQIDGCKDEYNEELDGLLHKVAYMGDISRVKTCLAKDGISLLLESCDVGGQTPLVLSARQGHAEVVAALLIAGADPDHADTDGWTPLRSAAWAGHVDVVDSLLQHGAQVDLSDGEGRTALRAAAWGGHEDIVTSLLAAGADTNACDRDGRTPLIAAAYMGHAEIVEALLNAGADADHADADWRTALSVAALCLPASEGHAKSVLILLERGACVDHQDREGMTPLLVAAFEGHRDVCELLLEYEADADHSDLSGRTPLWAAASMGHASVVELLLFWGCYVDSIDSEGRTVLSVAAAQGSAEVVKRLLDRGLDEMHRDNSGWTPLHYASFEGHKECCELLVEAGSRIEEGDNEGKTGLILAAQEGHEDTVNGLIRLTANIQAKSHDGKTPLRAAALSGHKDVVHSLLVQGADVNYIDPDGRSTLYLLSLENCVAMSRFLICAGASLETRDLEGRTPLHVSAWQGHEVMVMMLLDAGSHVDSVDKENRTALHSASWQGHHGVVKLLLQRGAQPDHPCNQGATALCIAAQEGHVESVRTLLMFGADPNLSDRCGRNAVRVAVKSGHDEIVQLLEEHAAIGMNDTPPTQPTSSSSASAASAETKLCNAVVLAASQVGVSNSPELSRPPTVPNTTTGDSPISIPHNNNNKRCSYGNTSSGHSSSNLTSSTKSSQHSIMLSHQVTPQHNLNSHQQPLAPLAFTQQVQVCSKVRPRPSIGRGDVTVLSPLSEPLSPLYASPPQSPLSEIAAFSTEDSVAETKASAHARLVAASSMHCPFSSDGGKGDALRMAPLAFTRDSHMKIILGSRNAAEAKIRRNGIVTNPNLKAGFGRLGFGGLYKNKGNGHDSPTERSNGFPWKKETPL